MKQVAIMEEYNIMASISEDVQNIEEEEILRFSSSSMRVVTRHILILVKYVC